MKLNVLFSPLSADELFFTGKTTVVIDVLRASSTIVTAFQNGAKEIIPVATVEFAVKVSGGMFGGQTLLGGERNTKKVEGFALGNSPLEYTREVVEGKSIILFTTNGTKAIVKAKFSEYLFICSLLNVKSIAEELIALNNDVEILCAGKNNSFSLEDILCAGELINEIKKNSEISSLNDAATASSILASAYGQDYEKILSETEHGRLLVENEFIEDIKHCAQLNSSNIIPVFNEGSIKLYNNKNNLTNADDSIDKL